MSQFTTRVELHDAVWSDYTKLHQQMAARGFRQTVTAVNGAVYELPPAEYDYEGTATRAQVLEMAKEAAKSVKSSFAVITTESAGRTWYNLKLLKKAAA